MLPIGRLEPTKIESAYGEHIIAIEEIHFSFLFLLIFMGIMDVVLAVSFGEIALLGIAVFGLIQCFLNRKI